MTPISRNILAVFLLTISVFLVHGQDSGSLIFVSRSGVLESRVFCREVVQCVGTGTSVVWTFFGFGVTPIPNTETRYTNTSSMVVNGSTIITANLTFDPLSSGHDTLYVCHVNGPNPASSTIRVVVQSAPVILRSDIENIDLSQYTIGDPITVACQVETCLSDVTATFYKGSQVLQTTTVTNNQMKLVTFAYTITVAEDSAGEYACRAVTPQGGTPNDLFTLSGTPRAASTSTAPSSTSTIITPSSSSPPTTSSVMVGNSVTATVSSSSVEASPTVSVSPSPGGASHIMIEWSLLLSLLIITLVSLIVW